MHVVDLGMRLKCTYSVTYRRDFHSKKMLSEAVTIYKGGSKAFKQRSACCSQDGSLGVFGIRKGFGPAVNIVLYHFP